MFIIVLHFHTWNNLILQEDAAQYLTVVTSRMMFNQRPSPPLPPPPPPPFPNHIFLGSL